MKYLPIVAAMLVAVACGVALLASIVPGLLLDVIVLGVIGGIVTLPITAVLVLSGSVYLFVAARRRRVDLREGIPSRRQVALVAGLMAGTVVLLALRVPVRAAFLVSIGGFDRIADATPAPAPFGSRRDSLHDQWAGVYRIRESATDHRGGVYCVVHRAIIGIGPDTESYGFARAPNTRGSPFGNADYRLAHVWGDWYMFAANNDY